MKMDEQGQNVGIEDPNLQLEKKGMGQKMSFPYMKLNRNERDGGGFGTEQLAGHNLN